MQEQQLDEIASWFDHFVAGFGDASSERQRNYDLKIEHTWLVRDNMERLTDSLGLPPEERALAIAIAICHDVGRFPQFRDYGTFNDATSVNHAALALQTLKGEGALDCLADEQRTLLQQAVALHNVFVVPDDLDPVISRFARLIRDADKLDIWRVLIDHCSRAPEERASAVTWELPDTGVCSLRALEEVIAGRMVDRSLLETADDFKLLQLSWVFDLNFAESFRMLAERGYIETLGAMLPDQSGCREVAAVVRKYIKSRLS